MVVLGLGALSWLSLEIHRGVEPPWEEPTERTDRQRGQKEEEGADWRGGARGGGGGGGEGEAKGK